jgi:hypothetical protein
VSDCRELLETAHKLINKADVQGISFDHEAEDVHAADIQFHNAADIFAKTPLALLKSEGLKTGFTEGESSRPHPSPWSVVFSP